MRRAVPIALALASALLFAPGASGAQLEEIGDFAGPVHVTSEPGNPDRLYVVEQDGRIRLVTPNTNTLFVDLDAEVRSSGEPGANGEQGLLSVAFPPDFAESGLLYVFFTDTNDDLRIAELSSSGAGADPDSLRDVLTVPHRSAQNHNGGQLAFGPDGFLYIATGDGGGSGDPDGNAQSLESRLGKILRIDPSEGGGEPYSVPGDNPFVGAPPALGEIWSYGLRNPWRFSFDRLTGDLTIGDVGQGAWEEIDFVPAPVAGRATNFGWNCFEGTSVFASCPAIAATPPVLEYQRTPGRCASVAGGFVVRDPGLTELYGRYLYADTCMDWIRSTVLAASGATEPRGEATVPTPTSFGEDACGRVYVASLGGVVSRFVDGTPTDCSAVTPPPEPPPQGDCGAIIRGSTGDDELRGGPGAQELIGLAGRDTLRGEGGGDCIFGGAGKDRIRGGGGRDEIAGGRGRDMINAKDGERDDVACGPGGDRAKVDRKDRVRGCERG